MENIKIFWGVDHKVGTTMIAQSYGESLASRENESVLLLTLSHNLGDDFFSEQAISINELRSKLSCGLLTEDDIRNSAVKGESIYKLNGLLDHKDMYAFTIEMIIDLLQISSRVFDYVIVDAGTGLNSPLSIGSLTSQAKNIFVLSQNESSLRKWNLVSDNMSKLSIMPQAVVINKFFKGDKYNLSYISQRTGIPQNLFETVTESEFGVQAESEQKTLLYFGESQFEKDIGNLVN